MSLSEVINKGRELFTIDSIEKKPSGIKASLGGFFDRPFGRDSYFSLLGMLAAKKDFGVDFVKGDVLVRGATAFLKYMNDEGCLPHEVGYSNEGYPFEVDETGFGKHYSSIDATGLALLVLCELMDLFPKNNELKSAEKSIIQMLVWSTKMVEENNGLVGYSYSGEGSRESTWQDGAYGILTDKGELPQHPLYPVVEQGIYWSALNNTADRFMKTYPSECSKAKEAALKLEKNFNSKFIFLRGGVAGIARAIHGDGELIHGANIDSLVVLGFEYNDRNILSMANKTFEDNIVEWLTNELLSPVGLRTQGISTPQRNGYYYHTKKSIWPFMNIMAVRTFEYLGRHTEAMAIATKIKQTLIEAGSPVETLQVDDDGSVSLYKEVRPNGEVFTSSKIQAWTVGWGVWLEAYDSTNTV